MSRSLRSVITAGLVGLAVPLTLALSASPAAAAPVADAAPAAAKVATKAKAKHITIPKNYVYNPKAKKQRTLHDYCSYSPDEFRNPFGKNANFRGPCARHDMCIQYKQHKRSVCDTNLLSNLQSECRWTYGKGITRNACLKTAKIYWKVVHIKTKFS